MANSALSTGIAANYKRLYPHARIYGEAIADHPVLGLLKRRTDFTGAVQSLAVRYANSTSRSATFTDAQANANLSLIKEYLIQRKITYHVVSLSPEEIYAAEGRDGAYMSIVKETMQSVARSLGEDWSGQFLGVDGQYGVLATLTNFNTSTGVATVANAASLANVHVGMVLGASDDAGTTGSTIRAGTGTVTAVDQVAGTFTVSPVNPSGWANGANTDEVFLDGDVVTAGSAIKMAGFYAWNPATLPSSDNFHGVNRAEDRARLAGTVFDCSGYRIDEAIKHGIMLVNRNRGKVTDLVLNHETFLKLLNTLEHKERANFDVTLREGRFMTKVGYEGVKIYTTSGAVNVWADASNPVAYGAAFNREDWTLHTIGQPGRMIEYDGHSMQWAASTPNFEFRFITLGNFTCTNPVNNLTLYNLDQTA